MTTNSIGMQTYSNIIKLKYENIKILINIKIKHKRVLYVKHIKLHIKHNKKYVQNLNLNLNFKYSKKICKYLKS